MSKRSALALGNGFDSEPHRMRSKRELNELNRKRESQRREKFVKRRIREVIPELGFAHGGPVKFAVGQRCPPDFALAAARLWAKTGYAKILNLLPDRRKSKERNLADVWEIFGVYQGLMSFRTNLPNLGEDKEERRVHSALNKAAARQISMKFLVYLEKLQRKTLEKIPRPPLQELTERAARFKKGTTGFATPQGELVAMKTATARIYYWLWFFWPMHQGRFDAPSIHSWLAKEMDERVSDKLVERVVTKIRQDAARAAKSKPQP